MTDAFNDREAWLTEAANVILDDVLMPIAPHGLERPPFRVSVGWPKGSRGGKTVAQCFKRSVSDDGVNEIFVSPEYVDHGTVLGALTHELIHAIDDCEHGHRGPFAAMARAAGLEGPLTATKPGVVLGCQLDDLAELLGPYPHGKMTGGRRKQATRQRKCECGECGAIWRASATWAAQFVACPCCQSDSIHCDV